MDRSDRYTEEYQTWTGAYLGRAATTGLWQAREASPFLGGDHRLTRRSAGGSVRARAVVAQLLADREMN